MLLFSVIVLIFSLGVLGMGCCYILLMLFRYYTCIYEIKIL